MSCFAKCTKQRHTGWVSMYECMKNLVLHLCCPPTVFSLIYSLPSHHPDADWYVCVYVCVWHPSLCPRLSSLSSSVLLSMWIVRFGLKLFIFAVCSKSFPVKGEKVDNRLRCPALVQEKMSVHSQHMFIIIFIIIYNFHPFSHVVA